MSKCWENSKYVTACVKANENQCLCEDAEFQSVRASIMPPSVLSALLRNSRWCSNVSTLNAKPLNSAPPFTKRSRNALILGWIPSMPCLLSSVTRVYASAEAQLLAMHQVISPHQLSTPWLVALSVLVRHVASATSLLTRTTCRLQDQWPSLHLQVMPKYIPPSC